LCAPSAIQFDAPQSSLTDPAKVFDRSSQGQAFGKR
jgi:hypothetical protein